MPMCLAIAASATEVFDALSRRFHDCSLLFVGAKALFALFVGRVEAPSLGFVLEPATRLCARGLALKPLPILGSVILLPLQLASTKLLFLLFEVARVSRPRRFLCRRGNIHFRRIFSFRRSFLVLGLTLLVDPLVDLRLSGERDKQGCNHAGNSHRSLLFKWSGASRAGHDRA